MGLTIREAAPGDATECGRICYEAFKAIAEAHNFPPDFPNTESAVGMLSMMIANPGFHGAVAELDGKIVGSNFLDERNPISGVGPISIDPDTRDIIQNVYIRKVEKKNGELYNVEFATFPNVKDPIKAGVVK